MQKQLNVRHDQLESTSLRIPFKRGFRTELVEICCFFAGIPTPDAASGQSLGGNIKQHLQKIPAMYLVPVLIWLYFAVLLNMATQILTKLVPFLSVKPYAVLNYIPGHKQIAKLLLTIFYLNLFDESQYDH